MNLVVIHKNRTSTDGHSQELLRFALCSDPISGVVFNGLSKNLSWETADSLVFAIPEEWNSKEQASAPMTISYGETLSIPHQLLQEAKRRPTLKSWFVISNGRFATQINNETLEKTLTAVQADIIAVNVELELLAGSEKLRLTTQGRVAGIRRLYCDSVKLSPLPNDWPHHLFIKTEILDQLFNDGNLPISFPDFIKRCGTKNLMPCAVRIGGTVLDLETENGLLNFCGKAVDFSPIRLLRRENTSKIKKIISNNKKNSEAPRIVGKVLLGENIEIGPKAIIVGPAILGNNVKIGQGAMIYRSIIGTGVSVPHQQFVNYCILMGPQDKWENLSRSRNDNLRRTYPLKSALNQQTKQEVFRIWPRFSYPRCFKRIVDCIAAIIVLILFAPVIPFIALAIKLTSPGPVFYSDKRQGLHGKPFDCLKFRTMLVGADKIQDKLRIASQVDGPQFKMENDPRLNNVGRFLRNTFIDEVPQFINVLLGQMSVVGPRPSPESENTLCPSWRDARLSVRPGITGLWQVCRTRKPMKDFQEWIHYDTSYVKNLSLRMDLWICWRTIKKIVDDFIRQF
jgi:lipopolysaccharide/colanic/teichoic acid biosynthesis glycosyltransferase